MIFPMQPLFFYLFEYNMIISLLKSNMGWVVKCLLDFKLCSHKWIYNLYAIYY